MVVKRKTCKKVTRKTIRKSKGRWDLRVGKGVSASNKSAKIKGEIKRMIKKATK
jgi:hypothetical protein